MNEYNGNGQHEPGIDAGLPSGLRMPVELAGKGMQWLYLNEPGTFAEMMLALMSLGPVKKVRAS